MEEHIDFDYAALDGELEPEDIREGAHEAFRRVLRFCWRGESGRKDCRAAFRRFVVLCAAYDRSLLHDANYRQLSDMLGCTKAAVSKILRDFCEEFRVNARERSAESREHMRAAQLRR